jgi:hypothetical protein
MLKRFFRPLEYFMHFHIKILSRGKRQFENSEVHQTDSLPLRTISPAPMSDGKLKTLPRTTLSMPQQPRKIPQDDNCRPKSRAGAGI